MLLSALLQFIFNDFSMVPQSLVLLFRYTKNAFSWFGVTQSKRQCVVFGGLSPPRLYVSSRIFKKVGKTFEMRNGIFIPLHRDFENSSASPHQVAKASLFSIF